MKSTLVEETHLEGLVGDLSQRLNAMEQQIREILARLGPAVAAPAPPPAAKPAPAAAPAPKVEEGISEEIVMVIAAAVAAFMGKRARIRRVRRVAESGMNPWSQQGRVSIQASHNVHWPRP